MEDQDTADIALDDTPQEDELVRLYDVSVELAVEIGRTRMTIRETLGLVPGSIVSLNRQAGEPVDLLVNGKPLARGEVVVIDEEFGLRITEILGGAGSAAERPIPAEPVGESTEAPVAEDALLPPFDDLATAAAPAAGQEATPPG